VALDPKRTVADLKELRELNEQVGLFEGLERSLEEQAGLYELARAPQELVEEAAAKGPRHLLVIAEDWCGDASSTVPVLVKFADAVPGLDHAPARCLDDDRFHDPRA